MPVDPPMELLNPASDDIYKLAMKHLVDERGVHIETAISACAALGGVALLRSANVDLSKVPDGAPVLVDAVDKEGPRIIGFISAVADAVGINPDSGWNDDVPPDNRAHKSGPELVQLLEPEAVAVYDSHSVPAEWVPAVGALAALKIVYQGQKTLSPEIGKALLMQQFVASAKTKPLNTP